MAPTPQAISAAVAGSGTLTGVWLSEATAGRTKRIDAAVRVSATLVILFILRAPGLSLSSNHNTSVPELSGNSRTKDWKTGTVRKYWQLEDLGRCGGGVRSWEAHFCAYNGYPTD